MFLFLLIPALAAILAADYLMAVGSFTFGGKTFDCSGRTKAHLRWTYWRLKRRYPWASLRVIQGCYRPGEVAASAGTHNKDACLDVRIVGITWSAARNFLRYSGWAAWVRTPDQGPWDTHIHMVSIPTGLDSNPSEAEVSRAFQRLGIAVGSLVPAQVRDYYAHALGLRNGHAPGSDRTLHPKPINAYVFKG